MKKIALVVDTDNWAFYNIATNIKKGLSHKYEFKIIPMANIDDNIVKLWLLVQDCDLVHFFWRGHTNYINDYYFNYYVELLGGNPDEFRKNYILPKKISTCVYDHLFLDNDFELTEKIFSTISNYYVSSEKLFRIYNDLPIKYKPNLVITDGIDLKKFFPMNIKRFSNVGQREIVIGWVGNSDWVENTQDFKGVKTILKPAIEKLISEGYNVKMFFADRQERMIPHTEMNNYYSQIDIYVCSSKMEGTPNPVLEAMACGVPIVTTDVGIVPEALGKKQSKYILEERNVEKMVEKLKLLINNIAEWQKLSEENIERVQKWSWENKMSDFDSFFTELLNEK